MNRTRLMVCFVSAAVAGMTEASWAAEPDQGDEIRAIVSGVIADAESRSSLLDSRPTAGHDGKAFFLQAADGTFRLNVRGMLQFRYYLDFRDGADADGDGSGEDNFESGFQTRRTKIGFEGHAFAPSLFYRVLGAFNRSSGDWRLEEAFAGYKWGNGFSLQWGQFKLPFLREETTSSSMQLAVERSTVNDSFSLFRSQGMQATFEQEQFRVALAFSDGAAAENSEFASRRTATSSGVLNRTNQGESDYAVTARLEWKPVGEWAQFKDFTSPEGSSFALLLGAAGSSSAFTAGAYEYAAWTADLSLEGDGWNAYAALVGGHSEYHATAFGDVSNDDYGLLVQGGVIIPETKIEPFARYSALFPDPDRSPDGSSDVFGTLTLGFNCYLQGHAAKFTFDANWYIEESDPLATRRSGLGQLGDDNKGEVTLRLQWQLLF